jgi:hypothetical protein
MSLRKSLDGYIFHDCAGKSTTSEFANAEHQELFSEGRATGALDIGWQLGESGAVAEAGPGLPTLERDGKSVKPGRCALARTP